MGSTGQFRRTRGLSPRVLTVGTASGASEQIDIVFWFFEPAVPFALAP
jgi:hypothetical protein